MLVTVTSRRATSLTDTPYGGGKVDASKSLNQFVAVLGALPSIDARPERQTYIRPGLVLLMDVIDQLGTQMFPGGHKLGEWTGKELLARSLETLRHTEPRGAVLYWETGAAKPPSTVATYTPSYIVPTVAGPRPVKVQAEAEELWRREGPAVLALRAEERAARSRFDLTAKALRDRLAIGEMEALLLDPADGTTHIIVKEAWASANAADVFVLSDRKDNWAKPNYATMSCRTGSFLVGKRTGHVVVPSGSLKQMPMPAIDQDASPPTNVPEPKEMPLATDESLVSAPTTGATEKSCRIWLEAQMRASSGRKSKGKGEFLLEARSQQSWGPNLGERAFLRAWNAAIANTGAHAWVKAGAIPGKKRAPRRT